MENHRSSAASPPASACRSTFIVRPHAPAGNFVIASTTPASFAWYAVKPLARTASIRSRRPHMIPIVCGAWKYFALKQTRSAACALRLK